MGFEPTTLRDLVGCSTTELLETLWSARVKLWVLTGTTSRGYTATSLADMNPLTASRCHIKASHMNSLTASRRQRDAVSGFISAKHEAV